MEASGLGGGQGGGVGRGLLQMEKFLRTGSTGSVRC